MLHDDRPPQIVRFEPGRGRALDKNLTGFHTTLDVADSIRAEPGGGLSGPALDLLVAFHVAAFPDGRTILGSAAQNHLRELDQYNPHILRLIPLGRLMVVKYRTGGIPRRLRFGRFVGTTAVYPLTEAGYDSLTQTDIGIAALFPHGIVPGEQCGEPQPFLYLGGIIDVRRLNHPDWVRGRPARAVLAALRHIARFLPPLYWRPGAQEDRLATDRGPLPRLCGFADDGSVGAKCLWRAGFREVGAKWNGELKFALDLADWNTGVFDPKRRAQVRVTVRAIQAAAGRLRR